MKTERQYEPGTDVVIDPPESGWSSEGTVKHDEVIDGERLYVVDVDGVDDGYKRFRPWDLQAVED